MNEYKIATTTNRTIIVDWTQGIDVNTIAKIQATNSCTIIYCLSCILFRWDLALIKANIQATNNCTIIYCLSCILLRWGLALINIRNSKTFKSIFEPYYAVNKMWGWFVHNCLNVSDTKRILQLCTNLYSITATSNSWNIAFYCKRIFDQTLSNSEMKWSYALIVFLLTHEEWDFLDWHFSNYGPNLV